LFDFLKFVIAIKVKPALFNPQRELYEKYKKILVLREFLTFCVSFARAFLWENCLFITRDMPTNVECKGFFFRGRFDLPKFARKNE